MLDFVSACDFDFSDVADDETTIAGTWYLGRYCNNSRTFISLNCGASLADTSICFGDFEQAYCGVENSRQAPSLSF